ncbi:calcium-binding protein [Inquilinus sp. Marseille-Q2685]|uniref:calcium-binding protein n=1 Tax=Inquilinus sp. Marseille-Q2685 TaxID=2866581 RepID=UPI001CE407D4|nr:calcium-binding protein [Inquilinus sp. Marseille-Q2685]
MNGTAGNDVLYGNDDTADTVNGFGGNDQLQGGGGNDVLNGGDGNDLLTGEAGADRINGGAGIDTADWLRQNGLTTGVSVNLQTGATGGGAAGDVLTGIENLRGGNFNDTLIGNAGANTLTGAGGADTMNGGDGNDTVSGQDGNDRLNGGNGNDYLNGGAGSDLLDGGAGIDTVSYGDATARISINLQAGQIGGAATGDTLANIENLTGTRFDDYIAANAAANVLSGGAGNDQLRGQDGNDTLYGGAGADDLNGGNGNDNLNGGAGNDAIAGSAGADNLAGYDGNDYLVGGAGADRLNGGAGVDTVSYAGSAARVAVILSNGTASGGDAEGDTFSGIENLAGSSFSDYLGGNASANTLNGGAGDDGLSGKGGADRINGGAGIDMADYIDSGAAVTIDLAAGTASGGDAAGDTLTSIESLRGPAFDDPLTGNDGDNRLSGLDGVDTLNGGAGQDKLIGGAGADILNGGDGFDMAGYDNASAGLTVSLADPSANTGDAVGDVYNSIEDLLGSQFNDVLTGDAGTNYIIGYYGDDRIDGGGGADTLVGSSGADTFVFSTAADTVAGNPDRINDFSQSDADKIDVSAITGGSGSFIGTAAFSGAAGEVRYEAGTEDTQIYIDANGDGSADAQIRLIGVVTLTAGDFVL